MRLFVYGTLRNGCGNDRLLEGSRSPALVRTGWTLYEFAGGAYPVMLPGGTHPVVGEVVDVDIDGADFRLVDRMERGAGYHLTPVRADVHTKVVVQQRSGSGETVDLSFYEVEHDVECFTYGWFDPDDDWIGRPVPDGDWLAHVGLLRVQRTEAEAAAYRDARL